MPKAYGRPQVSYPTIAEVFAIIAAAETVEEHGDLFASSAPLVAEA